MTPTLVLILVLVVVFLVFLAVATFVIYHLIKKCKGDATCVACTRSWTNPVIISEKPARVPSAVYGCGRGPSMSTSTSNETNSTPHLDDALSTTSSRAGSDGTSSDDGMSDGVEIPSCDHVLVVGSLQIPVERHAQTVVLPLLECLPNSPGAVNILMHGIDQDEAALRLTPSQWVQQAMRRARFVLCICNKEFMDDWNYDRWAISREASLVKCVSQRVAGLLNHGHSDHVSRKFVAVVLCEDDLRYIPENLKECNYFLLNCEASIQELGRFLLGTSAVIFQRS